MSLRYGLIPNHLTDDPNDYMSIVIDNDTVSAEDTGSTNGGQRFLSN